jgi:hypothetical protein
MGADNKYLESGAEVWQSNFEKYLDGRIIPNVSTDTSQVEQKKGPVVKASIMSE